MGGKILEYEARSIKEAAEKEVFRESARYYFEDGKTYEVVRNRIPADIISDDELNAIRNEVKKN